MTLTARSAVFAVLAAVSLTATAALAQGAPRWIVDQAHSQITFDSAAEGAPFEGRFQSWNADIQFDPKQLDQSKVEVSVDTGSVVTGDDSRDQTAHSSDWFATVMFPKATFVTNGFKDLGGGHYEADGDLTIRGITKPLVLPFTLTITGDEANMTGETSVDRSLFGVGQGDYGGADIVPFDVKVHVALQAKLAR